jgi:hypothetical protein
METFITSTVVVALAEIGDKTQLLALMLAARFGSMKILLSGDITSESRVLYHRTISDRARRALPHPLLRHRVRQPKRDEAPPVR